MVCSVPWDCFSGAMGPVWKRTNRLHLVSKVLSFLSLSSNMWQPPYSAQAAAISWRVPYLGPMRQRLPIGRTMGGFLGLWSLRKKHEPPNERITQKLHVRWGTLKKWPFKGRYTVCVYIYTADIFHIHPYSNHRFEGQSFSATAKSHGQIIERSATQKT